jgi:predicted neuraminidase
MVGLANGNWVLVYNHSEHQRNNLAVAISEDEGENWKIKYMENDERKEKATRFHYPAVICGKNGILHTVYSYHRNDIDAGKTVKWASFTEKWISE